MILTEDMVPFIVAQSDVLKWSLELVAPEDGSDSIIDTMQEPAFVKPIVTEFYTYLVDAATTPAGSLLVKAFLGRLLNDHAKLTVTFFDAKCPRGSLTHEDETLKASCYMLHVSAYTLALHAIAFAKYSHEWLSQNKSLDGIEPGRVRYCTQFAMLNMDPPTLEALWKDAMITLSHLTPEELASWKVTYSEAMQLVKKD